MGFKYNSFSIGTGEPVVFQHGLAANLEQIRSLLGGLEGISLHGIDCPGHGSSQLGDFSPSFDNYADQVLAYMDHIGLEKVVLGGLSMGSGIALNIYLRYPERIKGLILHRPAWLNKPNPENLMILKEAIPYFGSQEKEEAFKRTASFQKIEREVSLAAKSVMGIFADTQQGSITEVLEQMVGDCPFDSMDKLEKIQIPTLILANDDDPLHPYAMGEKIHSLISNSVLEKITSRYVDGDQHSKEVRNHVSKFINKIKEQ